jgi:hypothetical protein
VSSRQCAEARVVGCLSERVLARTAFSLSTFAATAPSFVISVASSALQDRAHRTRRGKRRLPRLRRVKVRPAPRAPLAVGPAPPCSATGPNATGLDMRWGGSRSWPCPGPAAARAAVARFARRCSLTHSKRRAPTNEVTTIVDSVTVDSDICADFGFDVTLVENGTFKTRTFYDTAKGIRSRASSATST